MHEGEIVRVVVDNVVCYFSRTLTVPRFPDEEVDWHHLSGLVVDLSLAHANTLTHTGKAGAISRFRHDLRPSAGQRPMAHVAV